MPNYEKHIAWDEKNEGVVPFFHGAKQTGCRPTAYIRFYSYKGNPKSHMVSCSPPILGMPDVYVMLIKWSTMVQGAPGISAIFVNCCSRLYPLL
jgi:hypothetical protein